MCTNKNESDLFFIPVQKMDWNEELIKFIFIRKHGQKDGIKKSYKGYICYMRNMVDAASGTRHIY